MTIDEFNIKYVSFKDADKIEITCDHPQHDPIGEVITIGKQPAKRNILKNGGKQFICRKCVMHYDNPMNHVGESRQTDEIIEVFCPHPEHEGEVSRTMKKECYYGNMSQPYLQVCGSCAQRGKTISEEQKEAISKALTGITRSDEFKKKLSDYMKNNPEARAKAIKVLLDNKCTTGMLGKHHSEETKKLMSEKMTGRKYTEEHKDNISTGRKKMLEETGGFTVEHRQNLSRATIEQYRRGFDPNTHHISGWHSSTKAGEVFYRSSYEKKAYLKLDEDETVQTYFVENVKVEYFNPIKKINSTYLIDIDIRHINGTRRLVEVKPECWLTEDAVLAKIQAGEKIAEELGTTYTVWTEMDLFGHVYNERNMRLFAEKVRNGEV